MSNQVVKLPTRKSTLPFSTGIIAEGKCLFRTRLGLWEPIRETTFRDMEIGRIVREAKGSGMVY